MKKFLFTLVFLLTVLYSAIALADGIVNNVRVGVHTKEHLRIVVDTSEPVFYEVINKGKFLEVKVEASKAEQVAGAKRAIASNQVGNSFTVGTDNTGTVVRLDLHEALENKNISDFVLRSKGANGTYRIVVDIYNRNAGAVNGVSSAAQPKPAVAAPVEKPVQAKPVITQPVQSEPVASTSTPKVPVVNNRPTVSSSPIKRSEEGAAEVSKPVAVKPVQSKEEKPVVVKKEEPKPVVKQTEAKASQSKTTAIKTNGTKATGSKVVVKKNEPKPVLSKDGKYTILKLDNGEPYLKSTKPFKTSGGVKGKLVVIDPGHGGSDPGAIGKGGTQEKVVTLQIATKLKENLEKAGAKVIMTRTIDKDVTTIPYNDSTDADELQARINIAEKNNADLLISLHNNSLNDRKIGGICTYYFNKTASDAKLAGKIQDKLGKGFQLRNMGTRQANFYMVKRCSMPAALIELCFISNAKEEALLKNSWFQKKSAKLISEAVVDYFK